MNRSSESSRGLPHSKTQARATCFRASARSWTAPVLWRFGFRCNKGFMAPMRVQFWRLKLSMNPSSTFPCSSSSFVLVLESVPAPKDRGRGTRDEDELAWPVHGPDARPILEVEATHEPGPLTPSLSPSAGERVSAGRVRGISTKFFRFISLILNVN